MLRRLQRRLRPRPTVPLSPVADGLPKTGFFSQPVRVTSLEVLDPELLDDGHHRASFRVEVRDADGRRCSELAVDAKLTGPERTADVQGVTDLFGRVRLRMAGPPGEYAVEILDVAANGLAWDREAGPLQASCTIVA